MSEAAKLPTETLARRAEIRKPKDPEYIPSEVLVHQMRDLHRAGNQADFNRLARPFVTRATAMLRKRAAGINDADFEDFAHRVLRAVFTELLSAADDYTFYEVAFNRIFRFRRWQAELGPLRVVCREFRWTPKYRSVTSHLVLNSRHCRAGQRYL